MPISIIIYFRWHRLGISVKGNTITAIIDCKQQQNRAIKREAGDTIIHDGIILLAQQIDDNTFFEVFKNFEIEIFSISLKINECERNFCN